MRVWRIASAFHADISGEGAKLFGGRWTPRGIPVVYASATLSLAALERFVHVDPDLQPPHFVAIPLELPDTLRIASLAPDELPEDWREYPAPESLQAIGARWVRDGASAALAIPSVVIPHEQNFLLNPQHADFTTVRAGTHEPFSFDPRMWKRRKTKRT